MKPKHAIFVAEYIKNGFKDGTAAALKAGYKGKNVRITAAKLLRQPNIAAEIQKAMDRLKETAILDRERVLKELAHVAICDIKDAFDSDGKLLPLDQMPESVRRAIAAVEVEALYEWEHGEKKRMGDLVKVKFWPKLDALRDIGRHLKMFTDKLEVVDAAGRAERLREARKRVAERETDAGSAPGSKAN